MATYLITQATGHQSRWTITHLLAAGAKVHALVRNLQKVQHPVLKQDGVTLFQGHSDNFDNVYQAAQGCKAVYLNTFPIPGLDTKQAQTIVDASRKAGVETIVASTTFCIGEPALWDNKAHTQDPALDNYFASKAKVEAIVREAGFQGYTILRPSLMHICYLLPNVLGNFPDLPTHAEVVHAMDSDARMPQVDASDVGRYAAAALQHPAKFNGVEIELCGENLTIEEIKLVLEKVSGRRVTARKRTPAEVTEARAAVNGQKFQVFCNNVDLTPVLAASQAVQDKYGIKLGTLEEALERDKERLLECIPPLS